MRVRPLVGQKLWFAPRRDVLGWGWTPISWEGWLCTAVVIGLCAMVAVRAETQSLSEGSAVASIFAVVVILVATCSVKGTSPGGRRRFEEWSRLTGR